MPDTKPTVVEIEDIMGPDALVAAWQTHVRQGRNLFKLMDLPKRELGRIKYAFVHGWLLRNMQVEKHLAGAEEMLHQRLEEMKPVFLEQFSKELEGKLMDEAKKKVRGLTKREKQELAFYRDLRDRIVCDGDTRDLTADDIRAMVFNFYQGREEM